MRTAYFWIMDYEGFYYVMRVFGSQDSYFFKSESERDSIRAMNKLETELQKEGNVNDASGFPYTLID